MVTIGYRNLRRYCDAETGCDWPYENFGDTVNDVPGEVWRFAATINCVGVGVAVCAAVSSILTLCFRCARAVNSASLRTHLPAFALLPDIAARMHAAFGVLNVIPLLSAVAHARHRSLARVAPCTAHVSLHTPSWPLDVPARYLPASSH